MNPNQIVRLNDFFDKNDIEKMQNELPEEFKPNGMAVIIGKGSSIELNKGLISLGVKGLSNHIRELKVYNDNMPQNIECVDDSSRLFMLKYLETNEYLFNCFSLNQEKFKEIESFDRQELKNRLQKLIDIL